MPGSHNVLNALAAIAVALELGVSKDAIRKGLAGFGGVKRRFTTTGVVEGVRVIDDYGHHPVEIAAVLKAARAVTEGKVVAVFQPHRFSRVRDLFQEFCSCFNDADAVVVADIYPAGEAPIAGVSRDTLVEGLKRAGHRHVIPLEGPDALAGVVGGEARSGDLVVCLGAGDITNWAYALPDQLQALEPRACATGANACRRCAAASSPMRPWRPTPGSGSAGRRTCCSCRRMKPTSRPS
jgi:UDP-N-acetylmuramate--alanine ligase